MKDIAIRAYDAHPEEVAKIASSLAIAPGTTPVIPPIKSEMVTVFKVGDWVICRPGHGVAGLLIEGAPYLIEEVNSNGCLRVRGVAYGWDMGRFDPAAKRECAHHATATEPKAVKPEVEKAKEMAFFNAVENGCCPRNQPCRYHGGK